MLVFRKTWCALFCCNARFEIHPFALLSMSCNFTAALLIKHFPLLIIVVSFLACWDFCLNFTIHTTCHVSEQAFSGNSSLHNYVDSAYQPRSVNSILIIFNKQGMRKCKKQNQSLLFIDY